MKTIKQMSAILLAILILVLSLPVATVFAADADMCYGRKVLSQMSNGDDLVEVYDRLVEECAVLDDKVDIPADISLSIEEIEIIYLMFYSDYPEYFWILKGIPGYWSTSERITAIVPIYDDDVNASNIGTMKTQFDNKVSELTSGLSGKSDYEKSKILHDRLCDTTEYVFGSHNQCAYGALIEGEAVCNGYAKAYQYLLKKVDIAAWYVSGDSYNPVSGNKVAHAWNVAKLDGKWYYTDVTWDDQGENIYYEYLNTTTNQLAENHIIGDDFKNYVPLCSATAANYYVTEDRVFSSYNQSKLINILKKDNYKSQIYISGDVNTFLTLFESNFESIMTELDATSASCTRAQLNRAIILTLDGDFVCSHTYTNDCDTNCNSCGAVRAITHSYGNWIITKQPTCVEQGSRYKLCSVCNDKVTESISATGVHIYDNNDDTTCNNCGAERTIVTDWQITVNTTGVYKLKSENYQGNFTFDDIAVFDKNNNEVFYNAKKQGWPLVSDQNYTVKFKDGSDNYSNIRWQLNNATNTIFSDTSAKEWYNDAITYSVGRGLISGYGGTTKFGPGDNIQRQDFLVILARLDGVDLTQYANKTCPFPDVPKGSYYEAAVIWGYENKIVTGYQNGKFGVGDKITREQLVTFLYRYADYKGFDVSYTNSTKNTVSKTYTDYKKVSDWSQDCVLWAIEKGVIKGKTTTTIVPGGNALRCEVAQIMYNIFLKDIFQNQ